MVQTFQKLRLGGRVVNITLRQLRAFDGSGRVSRCHGHTAFRVWLSNWSEANRRRKPLPIERGLVKASQDDQVPFRQSENANVLKPPHGSPACVATPLRCVSESSAATTGEPAACEVEMLVEFAAAHGTPPPKVGATNHHRELAFPPLAVYQPAERELSKVIRLQNS